MKLSKITIICLIAAAIMTAGILVVQAAGFVTYEDDATNPKMYLWDNVRMVGQGLKMSPDGAADAEPVGGGILKIIGKDLFVRGLIGFECADYPKSVNCQAAIGNIGVAFLTMDEISSDSNLDFVSQNSNITLNGLLDGSINIAGKLIIDNSKNLIVTDQDPLPTDSKSVFVNYLSTNELRDTGATDLVSGRIGLTLPEIRFDEISENDEAPNIGHFIMFYPKRLINLNVNGLGVNVNSAP
ncbi:MAG: hypothetical protein NTX82_03250 [Candidatus Parcubacteria bacterium]|nr:hypothetical protein [Candidatus Parcubacteria bacterium]